MREALKGILIRRGSKHVRNARHGIASFSEDLVRCYVNITCRCGGAEAVSDLELCNAAPAPVRPAWQRQRDNAQRDADRRLRRAARRILAEMREQWERR